VIKMSSVKYSVVTIIGCVIVWIGLILCIALALMSVGSGSVTYDEFRSAVFPGVVTTCVGLVTLITGLIISAVSDMTCIYIPEFCDALLKVVTVILGVVCSFTNILIATLL